MSPVQTPPAPVRSAATPVAPEYRAPAMALLICPVCDRDHVVGRNELASSWPQHCGTRMRVLVSD